MFDKVKNKEIVDRAVSLYEDWTKSQSMTSLKETKSFLQKAKNEPRPSALRELKDKMGRDGKKLTEMFLDNWQSFGHTPHSARKKFFESLIKNTNFKSLKESSDGSVVTSIGQSYYPVADRSKSMISEIDPTDRDIILQIRHAVTGGNLQIAAELMKASWGSLSLKERNGLIEWINGLSGYNVSVPGHEENYVPKSTSLQMKQLEKKSDMNKDQFVDTFLRTAQDNMKVQ